MSHIPLLPAQFASQGGVAGVVSHKTTLQVGKIALTDQDAELSGRTLKFADQFTQWEVAKRA